MVLSNTSPKNEKLVNRYRWFYLFIYLLMTKSIHKYVCIKHRNLFEVVNGGGGGEDVSRWLVCYTWKICAVCICKIVYKFKFYNSL